MGEYITDLSKISFLSPEEQKQLQPVVEKFAFKSNTYYNSLIDPNDPNDPLRRIVIPCLDELDDGGKLDASNEADYTKVPGLQHKYKDTVLLLVSNVCAGFCRFCFRKRLTKKDNNEVISDINKGIEYIRTHPEIRDVLLTGGDPLMLSTAKLEAIISKLRDIEHIKIIRIGSKIPAYNPYRILDDPTLPQMLAKYSILKKVYLMTQFNHPKELTKQAKESLLQLQKVNVMMNNQTPIIRGVNDDPKVLGELFEKLYTLGVPPYYVFICRPTTGNKAYSVPVEECIDIFEKSRIHKSGLASRARLIISHATGKIEVLGKDDKNVYMKYHRAVKDEDQGKIVVFKRNPEARWFDDYAQTL